MSELGNIAAVDLGDATTATQGVYPYPGVRDPHTMYNFCHPGGREGCDPRDDDDPYDDDF